MSDSSAGRGQDQDPIAMQWLRTAGAATRIVADVAIYRLRKREMANLGGSVSVMIVLGLTWSDLAVRACAAALMNLLIYLNNDYNDIDVDLASPAKRNDRILYLASHRGAAAGAQVALLVALSVVGIAHSRGLWLAIAAGLVPVFLYSARLKRVKVADIAIIGVCGAALTMVAFPPDRLLGWCLALQLGFFAACFQGIQTLRDLAEDKASRIRTTAVALGEGKTRLIILGLILATAVSATCVLDRWVGPALALALLVPFHRGRADRYWNAVRLLFGVGWLAMVALILVLGHSNGLWISVSREQVVPMLTFLR